MGQVEVGSIEVGQVEMGQFEVSWENEVSYVTTVEVEIPVGKDKKNGKERYKM